MTLPKAVLWDWDGTLADTLPFIRIANNHVRQHFGMPDLTDDEFRAMLAYSTREGFVKIYGDRAEEAKTVIYDFVSGHHTKNLQEIPDAENILNYFQTLDIPMGIVSNKRQEILDEQISYFGWQAYFRTALGAAVAEKDKPAPDPIFMARDNLDKALDTKDIWYVGDSETDLKAAQAAGCPCIFLQNKEEDQSFVAEYKPHLTIENYAEFREFLLQNR